MPASEIVPGTKAPQSREGKVRDHLVIGSNAARRHSKRRLQYAGNGFRGADGGFPSSEQIAIVKGPARNPITRTAEVNNKGECRTKRYISLCSRFRYCFFPFDINK